MGTLAFHVARICNGTPIVIETELNRIVSAGGTVTSIVPRQSIVPIDGATAGPNPSGYHGIDIIYTTGKL